MPERSSQPFLLPMKWLHRLYTEWKDNLAGLVLKYFSGATILVSTGIWQGGQEQSAIIEVINETSDFLPFKELAEEIKRVNHQREVLYTKEKLHSKVMFSPVEFERYPVRQEIEAQTRPHQIQPKSELQTRRLVPLESVEEMLHLAGVDNALRIVKFQLSS